MGEYLFRADFIQADSDLSAALETVKTSIKLGMISGQSDTDRNLLLSQMQIKKYKVSLEKQGVVIGVLIEDVESHYTRESLKYALNWFVQSYSSNLTQGVIVRADFYSFQKEIYQIFGNLSRETIIDLLYSKLVSATKKQEISMCVYIYQHNGILAVKNIDKRDISSLFPVDSIKHDNIRVKKVKGQKIIVARQNRIVVAVTGKNIQKMTKKVEKVIRQSKELIESLNSFISIDISSIAKIPTVKQALPREASPPVYDRDTRSHVSRVKETETARIEKRYKRRRTTRRSRDSLTTVITAVFGAFFLVVVLGTIGLGFIMQNFSPGQTDVLENYDFSWELPNEMKAYLDFSPHVMTEPTSVITSGPIPGPSKRVYQLTANWATIIPAIDNIIDEDEWAEATVMFFTIDESYNYLSNITVYALSDQLYFYFRIDISVFIPANNNNSVISKEVRIQFSDYSIEDIVDFDLVVLEDDLEWSEGGVIFKAIPDYKIVEMIQPSQLISSLNNDIIEEHESKTTGELKELPATTSIKLDDIDSFEIISPANGSTIKGIVLIRARLTGFDLSQWKVFETVLIVDFIEFPNSTIRETIVTDANTANNAQIQPVDQLIFDLSWDSNFIKPGARVVSVRTKLSNIMDDSRYIQINSYPVMLIKSQVLIVNKLKEVAIIIPNVSEMDQFLLFPVMIAIMISQMMIFYSKKIRSEYTLKQRGKGDES